jgi:DNA-binding beta-propeller fold protein YncE
MSSPGQGLCTALLAILTFFHHPGLDAASQTSKSIKHLFDITDSKAGSLVLPTDVEVYRSRIYIVDSGNNQLVVLNKDGKTQFSVGREGAGEGEFQDPVGIGIDHKGLIYVADTGNHRIQIFTADGKYSGAFAVSSGGVPVRPIDVAVDPKTGNIFVTGNNNHKVMVFDRRGRLVREWGGNGTASGQFRYPATIAVTRNFDIAVVDVFNTRIQLFQRDGIFLVAIGEWGVLPGQLFRPKGVAVDQRGYIYVSDSYMNVIQVFNDSGEFLYVLKLDAGHDLVTPSGIAVAANNRLYVAEMLKHRISVFQID